MYDAEQARLEREARETHLGTLGDTNGVNVARVEVSWLFESPGLGFATDVSEHAGYFIVHATGDEPGIETIYDVFEGLVSEEMERRRTRQGFADWQIDDTYAA